MNAFGGRNDGEAGDGRAAKSRPGIEPVDELATISHLAARSRRRIRLYLDLDPGAAVEFRFDGRSRRQDAAFEVTLVFGVEGGEVAEVGEPHGGANDIGEAGAAFTERRRDS